MRPIVCLGPFYRAKVQRGYSGMEKAKKMAKTTVRTAQATTSVERLRAEFKRKFGHSFDRLGYHGHPLFGYSCYGCGIHISKITNKGLREQLKLDVGEAQSGTQG